MWWRESTQPFAIRYGRRNRLKHQLAFSAPDSTSLVSSVGAKFMFLPVLSRGREPGVLKRPKLAFCGHFLYRADKRAKASVIVSQARGFNIEPLSVWPCRDSSFGGGSSGSAADGIPERPARLEDGHGGGCDEHIFSRARVAGDTRRTQQVPKVPNPRSRTSSPSARASAITPDASSRAARHDLGVAPGSAIPSCQRPRTAPIARPTLSAAASTSRSPTCA